MTDSFRNFLLAVYKDSGVADEMLAKFKGSQFSVIFQDALADLRSIPHPEAWHVLIQETEDGLQDIETLAIGRYMVGRSLSRSQIRVSDPSVSSGHCVITVLPDDRVTIQDNESRGGTFINNERVDGEHTWGVNDEVRIGNARLSLVKM